MGASGPSLIKNRSTAVCSRLSDRSFVGRVIPFLLGFDLIGYLARTSSPRPLSDRRPEAECDLIAALAVGCPGRTVLTVIPALSGPSLNRAAAPSDWA
jgi:hypothetical protein